jgi:hypothetical protein
MVQAPGFCFGHGLVEPESRSGSAVSLEQNVMVQPLPIMIGFALWFIFFVTYGT